MNRLPLAEERIRMARTACYGRCEPLDTLIGKIPACLDQTRLAGNTLVVASTDHGEMVEVRHRLLARLFDRWSPKEVHREARQAAIDWATLSRWGKRVQPPCPDALDIPPPSLEANVELL